MRPPRAFAALLALAVLAAAAATPAPASAAVRWTLTAEHGPQNIAPGGLVQYVLGAYDVGDTDTAGAYSVKLTLPAGAVVLSSSGAGWGCSGLGTAVATCSAATTLTAPGPAASPNETSSARGAAQPLVLTVKAPASAGTLLAEATVSGGGAAEATTIVEPTPVAAAPASFGFVPGSFAAGLFESAGPTGDPSAGAPARQAGSHPFELRVAFRYDLALLDDPDDPNLGNVRYTYPEGEQRNLQTRLPAGLIGNPQALPACPQALLYVSGTANTGSCPAETQIGTIDLRLNKGKLLGNPNTFSDIPVYNVKPPPGYVAAFGFAFLGNPILIVAGLDPTHHDSVLTEIRDTISALPVRSAELTMWGVPANPAHDSLRAVPGAPEAQVYGHPSDAPERPFLRLPTGCDAGGAIEQRADSWQAPGAFTPWASGAEIKPTGCEDPRIRFEPSITIQPTSDEAAAPTGLNVDLTVPQNEEPEGLGTPDLRTAVTHLPEGMRVNASAAGGLAGCSEAQIGLEGNEPPSCPDASKLGTVEIVSPLVPEPMTGFIYQARQFENPGHSLLGFYTSAHAEGITIKLAAEVVADPQTGELTTIYRDNPQLPFIHYRLHFWGGPRAPLVNPPSCGAYTGSGTFTAWNSSIPPVTSTDVTHINVGPGGGPCPSGAFAPRYRAGTSNPLAGAFSPFGLDVSREDGTQGLARIDTTLPPGLLARLAGVPYCPDAALAAIPTTPGTGVGEREHSSCPAASLIGHLDAAAGAGPTPFHDPGSVYLAGPYRGAPLSLAVVTPVVGGPLDLGNVVVRAALFVDPMTAQVRAVSDPLPSMIAGIPLNLRSVQLTIDRPQFTINPTSCEPSAVAATLGGLAGASATLSDRFQVGGCESLGFKPRLSIRLKGKTRRAGNPALRATLAMPASGQANIARATVSLPHTEFLAQGHLGNVCTRVQYAEGGGGGGGCPARSIYGHARAWSPLLEAPLEGPVYLRSNGGERKLPDLVASLGGQIHIDLVGYVSSNKKTHGLETSFATAPDAPVSKIVLTMPAGKHSLLENSTNICREPGTAQVAFAAHNGRRSDTKVKVAVAGCGKRRPHGRHGAP